jgi:hypothetical protein
MTDYLFIDRMLYTAKGQRRLVAASTTVAEREHHMNEMYRFEQLAALAEVDSAAARRAYRPVRAFEPAA